jgi:hypothetical protein
VLTLRLLNRLLAVLLSLAVVVAAVLLTIEVVRWALDEPPWLVDWHGWGESLAGLRAGDPEVLVASTLAVLAGLLLLVFELRPRGPKALPTAPLVEGVETVTTRRGVRTAAETAARSVNGVRAASVGVRRRRVDVTARTRLRGPVNEVHDGVQAEVEKSLRALELEKVPSVRVKVEEEG